MAHSLWPLFDLQIRTTRLELRLPTDDELVALAAVARAGIHPADEMPFGIAWSVVPSPAFEQSFAQHHWRMRAAWSAADWALNLAVFHDGSPIGSQSIHARNFPVLGEVSTGSWLGAPFQRQGFGTEMRAAVLALAFGGLGAEVALSEAFLDNFGSSGVSRALGYRENGLGRLAPQGVTRDTMRFRLTADEWHARERPPVTIEGLDSCRDLFGAAR